MSDTEQGFEIFHWRGQKRYRCNRVWEGGVHCEYDTHDMTQLLDHIREPHTLDGKPAPQASSRLSPILSPNGDHMIVEEQAPEQFSDFKFKG